MFYTIKKIKFHTVAKLNRKKIEKRAAKIVLDETKPIYYIIRRIPPNGGFFSNYFWVLGHIVYAKEKNMIPVVDMKSYPSLYNEYMKVNGTMNGWNYYFENPEGVSLTEAYSSNNFILGANEFLEDYSKRFCTRYSMPSQETIQFYRPFIQKHMQITLAIANKLEDEWYKLRSEIRETKIIGMHVRGTDMRTIDPTRHIQTPTIDGYLETIDRLIEKEQVAFFLATDELSIVEELKARYGEVIHCAEAYRANQEMPGYGIHSVPYKKEMRKEHRYRMGYEVLRDAYFLSKCDALICAYSNVVSVAIMWNDGKYEAIYNIADC